MAYFENIKILWGETGVKNQVTDATPLPVTDNNSSNILLRILQFLMSPVGYDKSLQRMRQTSVIESGTVTTVSTVTTVNTVTVCGTVTNLSTIDTLQGRLQVLGVNVSAWSDCVRARIT